MCQSESRTGLTVHNQPPCLSDDFIISSTLKYKMTDVYLYVASSMQRVMVCVFVLRINGLWTYNSIFELPTVMHFTYAALRHALL